MAGRKLVRDFVLSRQPFFRHLLLPGKVSSTGGGGGTRRFQKLLETHGCSNNFHISSESIGGRREYSVFNEFSKKFNGEVNRAKQTTEQLYKHVDGVWTEAEATTKKVYANVEEKISAAKEEVKETFGIGKQEASGSGNHSDNKDSRAESKSPSGDEKQKEQEEQQSEPTGSAQTLFGKVKSGVSSVSSLAFQKLKEAKPVDLAKKGYDIVIDELKGEGSRRNRIKYAPSSEDSSSKFERSTRTDIAVIPSRQSRWSKKWEAFKEKMQGHPIYKRISGFSEPVLEKSQEIAEDMQERWQYSDSPIVHKIQDINETVFGETNAALSFKEIRRRDPYFSLPEFVAEVQEVIRPVLNAYFKGDTEVLLKYCSSEVIERCKAEHKAFESQGIFFDNKILHISEVEVRETKMMGETPIIILAFQTQQVYCVRDRHGSITEGGKDTIHTVYYAWAMQQVDVEDLDVNAPFPLWKLREMQQLGVQALI